MEAHYLTKQIPIESGVVDEAKRRACISVATKDVEEISLLEEDNYQERQERLGSIKVRTVIEALAFDVIVLLFGRREALELIRRDEQCRWVVVGVIRPSPFCI